MSDIFEKVQGLSISHQPKNFIVVGAGGTGGYLIPNLARQISIQNELRALSGEDLHKLMIIDADEVEYKNLTRQNFISKDIGKNKAEVMAERYSRAFSMDIDYVPEYITSVDMLHELEEVLGRNGRHTVIIGCVDNNKTRALMNTFHKNNTMSFYLDSGNEEFVGQVVLGFNADYDIADPKYYTSPYYFDLPSIIDVHPEVGDATDKLPTELSCAEAAVSHPQNIITNQTAANIQMMFLNTILTGDRSGKGLTFHSVHFNAENGNFSTKFNKRSIIDSYKKDKSQTTSS